MARTPRRSKLEITENDIFVMVTGQDFFRAELGNPRDPEALQRYRLAWQCPITKRRVAEMACNRKLAMPWAAWAFHIAKPGDGVTARAFSQWRDAQPTSSDRPTVSNSPRRKKKA